MRDFLQNFTVSACSSIISKSGSAPLELWRLQRQNSFIPNSTLTDVVKKEGIRYLWKGNGVNLIKGVPQYSINYAIYSKINDNINNKLISGIISGAFSIGIIYPLETTRSYLCLQTNKNKFNGIYDVLRKNSIRQLYQGFYPSLLGFGTFSGFLFYFQDKYNTIFPNSPLSGGLAGVSALTISYPTDLVRRRLQLQQFDNTVPRYNNTIDAIKKIYKYEGGIPAFYRGLTANYVKSFVQWGIHFYALSLFINYMEKSKQSS